MAFVILTGIGYSLIIAGLILLWKRIQLLQETMLLLIMVFAVSALPVLTVPAPTWPLASPPSGCWSGSKAQCARRLLTRQSRYPRRG